MAHPTSTGCRAQDRCARAPQDLTGDELEWLADEAELEELAGILDSCLRAFYAAHDERNPCTLSAAELAERFAPGAKPANGQRAVRRAHRRIAATYGPRFREVPRSYGRATVSTARWIDGPGGGGLSRDLSPDPIVDLRDLELRAEANARARARDASRAPRKRRSPERVPRRPARPHGVTNPAILAPLACEEGVLEAIEAAHGRRVAWQILRELSRPRCHAHPDAARLAARTLPHRRPRPHVPGDNPLRLYRYLLGRAIDGDPLIDRPLEAARTVGAELDALLGPDDVPADERLEELEQRLAAVQLSGGDPERELELERAVRALRGAAPPREPPPKRAPVTPAPAPPPPRRGTSTAASFVAGLPAHLREALGGMLDDSS